MNPVLFTVFVLIVWGVSGAIGYLVARARESQVRITLQFRIADLERELTNMGAELRATSAEKAEWRKLAVSSQEAVVRLKLMIEQATVTMSSTAFAALTDPPSTREADRRATERRRAQEEARDSASDTRRAVGVSDDEAAPVPQLRDADDDH